MIKITLENSVVRVGYGLFLKLSRITFIFGGNVIIDHQTIVDPFPHLLFFVFFFLLLPRNILMLHRAWRTDARHISRSPSSLLEVGEKNFAGSFFTNFLRMSFSSCYTYLVT